jgi:hypothetical protein
MFTLLAFIWFTIEFFLRSMSFCPTWMETFAQFLRKIRVVKQVKRLPVLIKRLKKSKKVKDANEVEKSETFQMQGNLEEKV